MKRSLMMLLMVLLTVELVAQSADQIIQSNLFDPARGATENSTEADGPVEEQLPKDIPILDGIVFIGDYQRAIFRFKDDGTRKLESSTVQIGDSFGGARLLELNPREALISFEGKRYSMTVDSKNDLDTGARTARASEKPARPEPERPAPTSRVTSVTSKPPVARKPQNPDVDKKNMRSTPFGWTKGKPAARPSSDKKKRKDRTPF